MLSSLRVALLKTSKSVRVFSSAPPTLPLISIQDGTFYRDHPTPELKKSGANPPLFPNLTFTLLPNAKAHQTWAIVGPSNAGKTTFLEVLRGKHVCIPPTARSYPYLASDAVDLDHRSVSQAIHYVGFDGDRGGAGKSGARGAYMSARYESRREAGDFSVMDYLRGNTDFNPSEESKSHILDESSLEKTIQDLRLQDLLDMPMGNLSNGQIRRARIAKAILGKPLVLLLDEPFMGLDPPSVAALSLLLQKLADETDLSLILALRPQDPLPGWIFNLISLKPCFRVESLNDQKESRYSSHVHKALSPIQRKLKKPDVIHPGLPEIVSSVRSIAKGKLPKLPNRSREGLPRVFDRKDCIMQNNVVEMKDVHIKYGAKEVLGNWRTPIGDQGEFREGLWWEVKKGDRWGVFGPNGSGKTTLISLICSDHPLSYSLPIRVFGRSRLPELGQQGISVFDLQARIGQSSPEVHAFFPRSLSIRQVIENAWAETFLGTPKLSYENDVVVDACLRWFEAELNPAYDPDNTPTVSGNGSDFSTPRDTDWADKLRFAESPFSAQRVALFLRAVVKKPELVILDEAFSGMDEYVRDKCMLFLTWGELRTFAFRKHDPDMRRYVKFTRKGIREGPLIEGLGRKQTLICVSHVKEEVPGLVNKWVSLPEAGTGKPARFGIFDQPLDQKESQWSEIWAN